MNIGALLGAIPVLGIIAGLAKARYPRAPFVAAGVIIGIYAVYMASVGIWASTCWDCGGVNQRSDIFYVSGIFFGIIGFTTLLGVWLGARMSTMLGRLLHTARELWSMRRPPSPGNSDVS